MKSLIKLIVLALSIALVFGCSSTKPVSKPVGKSGGTAQSTPKAEIKRPGADVIPMDSGQDVDVDPLNDPESPLATKTIYFDLDKSEIKPEYRSILEAHATYLADHPDVSVTLEGHADERGSREYNIALGERRSHGVAKVMLLLGVSSDQIESVSFGEERPVAFGHDEGSWRLNRRVDLNYGG